MSNLISLSRARIFYLKCVSHTRRVHIHSFSHLSQSTPLLMLYAKNIYIYFPLPSRICDSRISTLSLPLNLNQRGNFFFVESKIYFFRRFLYGVFALFSILFLPLLPSRTKILVGLFFSGSAAAASAAIPFPLHTRLLAPACVCVRNAKKIVCVCARIPTPDAFSQ
jgi:hypothetical protein